MRQKCLLHDFEVGVEMKRKTLITLALWMFTLLLILFRSKKENHKLHKTTLLSTPETIKRFKDSVKLNRNITTGVQFLKDNSTMFAAGDREIALRFHQRLNALKSQCRGFHKSLKKSWTPNANFLIHYNRQILICAVPKAGSTSWHMLVWAMRRKEAGLSTNHSFYTYQDTVENHATSLKLSVRHGTELITYKEEDDDLFGEPLIHGAKRIILVRHPFARLISGWNQKFLPTSSYPELIMKTHPHLKHYMSTSDPKHRITWKDFAEFIVSSTRNMSVDRIDYHFHRVATLCRPCEYPYTYVVKSESINRDDNWLLRRLNATDIGIGREGVPPGGSLVNKSPSDSIKYYMKQLNDRTRKRLYKLYEIDFKLFGYTFDFETLESGGFE